MNKPKHPSPSKQDKVAESTSTAYNQSGTNKPDKDKSQRETEKQGDKVAEGTATYNQSVNTQSEKNQPPPPKVNTKRKKVVKRAAPANSQSRRVNKQSPPDDKKVAESTATTPNQNQSQSDQQQSGTDTSSTQVDMQQYATKADLEVAKGENIKEHGITREKMNDGFTATNNKTETLIEESTRFIIGTILSFLGLLIAAIGITIAILSFFSKT